MSGFDPKRPYPYQAIVDRPAVRWPGGARVAVWVVPNIEHYRIDIGPSTPDTSSASENAPNTTPGETARSRAIGSASTAGR